MWSEHYSDTDLGSIRTLWPTIRQRLLPSIPQRCLHVSPHISKAMRLVEVMAGGQALSPICVQRLPSSLIHDLSIWGHCIFDFFFCLGLPSSLTNGVVGPLGLCCCCYFFPPVVFQMHVISILQNKRKLTELFSFLSKSQRGISLVRKTDGHILSIYSNASYDTVDMCWQNRSVMWNTL